MSGAGGMALCWLLIHILLFTSSSAHNDFFTSIGEFSILFIQTSPSPASLCGCELIQEEAEEHQNTAAFVLQLSLSLIQRRRHSFFLDEIKVFSSSDQRGLNCVFQRRWTENTKMSPHTCSGFVWYMVSCIDTTRRRTPETNDR